MQVRECYLIMVGIISAVKRMHREVLAWEANRPTTEKMVMAISLRSKGHTVSGDRFGKILIKY